MRLALTSPIRVTSELIAVADVDTASRPEADPLAGIAGPDGELATLGKCVAGGSDCRSILNRCASAYCPTRPSMHSRSRSA